VQPKKRGLLSMMTPFGSAVSGDALDSGKIGAAAIETAQQIMREEVAYGPYDMR